MSAALSDMNVRFNLSHVVQNVNTAPRQLIVHQMVRGIGDDLRHWSSQQVRECEDVKIWSSTLQTDRLCSEVSCALVKSHYTSLALTHHDHLAPPSPIHRSENKILVC